MVTGRQIREVRHMLGWDIEILSDKAQVSGPVVEGAEIAAEGGDINRFHIARIQMALERAGVRFGQNGAVLMGIRTELP